MPPDTPPYLQLDNVRLGLQIWCEDRLPCEDRSLEHPRGPSLRDDASSKSYLPYGKQETCTGSLIVRSRGL